jgi:hypothetical protein
MARTMRRLQDGLTLPVVSGEKRAFDILAIPVNPKKKGLWDPGASKGYEVQTSARRDSVDENASKGGLWGVPMVWVTSEEGVLEEIRKETEDRDEYLVPPA